MYVSLNKMLNATNLGFMEHNYPYITPICSISSSPQRKRSIHNSNDNFFFYQFKMLLIFSSGQNERNLNQCTFSQPTYQLNLLETVVK